MANRPMVWVESVNTFCTLKTVRVFQCLALSVLILDKKRCYD